MANLEETKQAALKRDRSPAYPFISLKAAFERATAFDTKFGRHGSPMNKAGIAWGYKGDSSQSSQTLSALKYFGLVEYTGPTDDRKVALTEDARNYFRAQQASTKAEIAKSCALRPKAMQTYWSRWAADRPIDEVCLDQLVIKDNFTEAAAKVFLRVYDETIAFAGLAESGKIEQDDGSVGQEPEQQSAARANAPPAHPPALPRAPAPIDVRAPAFIKGAGMRQEVFSLDEGDVTIQWPDRISTESLKDFEEWLTILQRKVRRSVTTPTPAPPADDAPA